MRPNRHPLDQDSASRMLQGIVHPDDAPPGYGAVAGLLASAASSPPAVDEARASTTVAAMVGAIRTATPVPERQRRSSMIGKLFAGKALAVMATVALTASGAAAATGTLPGPVQGAVAGAVSHIGIELPDDHGPAAHPGDDAAGHDAGNDEGDTTSTTGATGPSPDDANHGSVVSGTAHDPALDGQPKGATVCAVASDGKCQAGDDHPNSGPGNGADNRGPGNNDGNGNTNPGDGSGGTDSGHSGDDPAGHDAGDDHGSTGEGAGHDQSETTVTTATTSTTADDRGAGDDGSGNSGKGKTGRSVPPVTG